MKRSDLDSVGFRAVDLAVLREKKINIPLSFIINNNAFEDFLAENGLKVKLEKIFHNTKAADAYKEILKLFNEAKLPKEFEEELSEAYESLSIDTGATASNIVSDWNPPFVSVFRSPSYLLPTDDTEGFMQNIKGKEVLITAIKLSWASVYSPESIGYRKKIDISGDFGMGIIIQKMKKIKQSAVSYSCSNIDESTIVVQSFFGYQDYSQDKQILGKDYHELDHDSLIINKADVNVQEYSLVRNPETDEIVRNELKESGSRQKLDDKQIYEVARISKRAKSFVGTDLKLYLSVRDDYTYVFIANRITGEPKRVTDEKEEIKLTVDDSGKKTMEHKLETIAGQEQEQKFEMPEIISNEEAKKVIMQETSAKEEKEELQEEIDENLKKDLEFLDEIEQEKEKTTETEVSEPSAEQTTSDEETVQDEVDKEVHLLEEVLKIKEFVERMEEHALNENHESYNQEARQIKDLLKRIRHE